MPQYYAAPTAPPSPDDSPGAWLGPTSMLDLQDPRLRMRARSLTQLSKSDREKALALYAFVKRLPYDKPIKLHLNSARQVLDAGRGDAWDKATLLVALLRLAKLPARLHFVQLRGALLKGLTAAFATSSRPSVEVFLDGHWIETDTYIYDAEYMAAARLRLKESGWDCGWGLHRDGHAIWDGRHSAWVGSAPFDQDPMVLADLGRWHDPQQFLESDAYCRDNARLTRALHWNLVAPLIGRAIRDLREQSAP